ncbi:hypothetical protein NSMM_240016 [Nitrosomonas mobilis]|uniref:Uncharacterized protein n=1 Tax=Nitrosomonas mobilis TaxID=51642 RepID=A0A1G5SBU7_9PROT|nr:hypothetical protein NSMM_240016 [Nitrosomonas mobilis]
MAWYESCRPPRPGRPPGVADDRRETSPVQPAPPGHRSYGSRTQHRRPEYETAQAAASLPAWGTSGAATLPTLLPDCESGSGLARCRDAAGASSGTATDKAPPCYAAERLGSHGSKNSLWNLSKMELKNSFEVLQHEWVDRFYSQNN